MIADDVDVPSRCARGAEGIFEQYQSLFRLLKGAKFPPRATVAFRCPDRVKRHSLDI